MQIVRSRRRTISLEISIDGELLVRAPHRIPQQEILRIVSSKQRWIEKKQKAVANRPKSSVPRIFAKWFGKDLHKFISGRVEYYSQATGIKCSSIKITSARRRWGSCTSKGDLNFSWRLMAVPLELIDYVVVHELMHIAEMNHSRRFWDKVGEVMPDYKARRKKLKHAEVIFC